MAIETWEQPWYIKTKREFLELFTVPEYTAIKAARSSDPIIDFFYDSALNSEHITLTHPQFVQGLAYMVGTGLLTQARANRIGSGLTPE